MIHNKLTDDNLLGIVYILNKYCKFKMNSGWYEWSSNDLDKLSINIIDEYFCFNHKLCDSCKGFLYYFATINDI